MRRDENEQAIKMLAQSALWYAWGQMDPVPGEKAETNALRQRGFDTDHGLEFMRLYEQHARDYANEKRTSRLNVLDCWREFVQSKERLGFAGTLTVDDIDRHVRWIRELAEREAQA